MKRPNSSFIQPDQKEPAPDQGDKRLLVLFLLCMLTFSYPFFSDMRQKMKERAQAGLEYIYDGRTLVARIDKTKDSNPGVGLHDLKNTGSLTASCTDCRLPPLLSLMFHYPFPLNEATAEELQLLPGIGPATAGRIISFRNSYGPFASLDALRSIEGIGPAKINTLRLLIDQVP